jgi:hypothetical protein
VEKSTDEMSSKLGAEERGCVREASGTSKGVIQGATKDALDEIDDEGMCARMCRPKNHRY